MKQNFTYLFFLILSFPFFAKAKNPVIEKVDSNIKPLIQKDTIYIIQQIPDDKTVKYYQEILEKTNGQLSLWWNPYGVLICSLGVLFTILTIIAAYLIYRQSKEYKELINESLTKHENVLGQLITEKNKQLKNIEGILDTNIAEYKEKLKNATEDNKKEISELIKQFEKQKESIDVQTQASYVAPEMLETSLLGASLYGVTRKLHKCSQCGFGYFVHNDPYGLNNSTRINALAYGSGNKTITCPKCGNVEFDSSPF